MAAPSKGNFRQRYDALELRRDALMERLTALAAISEKARTNPACGRARTLLNQTFRKSSLAQRAAVLEAADWLIALLDRASAQP
jgi:sporulation-control protein spo0M